MRRMALGAEYVDIEGAAEFAPQLIAARSRPRYRRLVAHLRSRPRRSAVLVLPAARVWRGSGEAGGQVASLTDSLPLFEIACGAAGHDDRGHVLLAWGSGHRRRACWRAAAESLDVCGQRRRARTDVGARACCRSIGSDRIDADAALYALVGSPIVHSLSPAMHNAGFAALGLNAVYVPIEARDAADFIGLRRARSDCAARASRFRSSARDAAPRRDRPSWRGASAPINTIDDSRRPLDRHEHRRRRLSRTAASAHRARRARGCRSWAQAAPRAASGWRRGRKARRDDRGAARTTAARAIAALVGGTAGEWPPPRGAGICWSTRRPSAARTTRQRADGRRGARRRLVYDLVYARPDTELMRAATRGLPRDRRPRDARRAGGAAVRDVDRPAAAGRSLHGRGNQ